jgi:hypothetical protein
LSSLTLCFPIGFHFLAYPNLFGIKGFVVVVVVVVLEKKNSLHFLNRIFFLFVLQWLITGSNRRGRTCKRSTTELKR